MQQTGTVQSRMEATAAIRYLRFRLERAEVSAPSRILFLGSLPVWGEELLRGEWGEAFPEAD